jgi:hypothetical protein
MPKSSDRAQPITSSIIVRAAECPRGGKLHNPKAFLCRVEAARRDRERTPDGKRLTDTHVALARKLAFCTHSSPSHKWLARCADCSTKTVQRALAILHALGLLTWVRRVVAVFGVRRRIANAYTLRTTPQQPVLPGLLQIKTLRINSSAKMSISAAPAIRRGRMDELAGELAAQRRRERLAAAGC